MCVDVTVWFGWVGVVSLCRLKHFIASACIRIPLGRPRSRWVDNIRMDLQEVDCGYMDWIGRAQDRDRWQDACECGNEPRGSVKCGEFLD